MSLILPDTKELIEIMEEYSTQAKKYTVSPKGEILFNGEPSHYVFVKKEQEQTDECKSCKFFLTCSLIWNTDTKEVFNENYSLAKTCPHIYR